MPRLFELEDLSAFPSRLRRQQVEFIGWMVDRFGVYAPVVPLLQRTLAANDTAHVTDLGSGSGGPIQYLAQQHDLSHAHFLLTDRFPSSSPSGGPRIHWHPKPVDALAPDAPGRGIITLFNVLHHFTPGQQRQLLEMHGRRGMFICEVLQPDVLTFVKILVATTVGQLLLAPWVRPFRWDRLLFTYVIPVNLITIPWDGLVSVLRVDHASALVERLRGSVPEGYTIEAGTQGPWWAPITWVQCNPERQA